MALGSVKIEEENKLASLEATLVETTTHSLTEVKCRATSVAKKEREKGLEFYLEKPSFKKRRNFVNKSLTLDILLFSVDSYQKLNFLWIIERFSLIFKQ